MLQTLIYAVAATRYESLLEEGEGVWQIFVTTARANLSVLSLSSLLLQAGRDCGADDFQSLIRGCKHGQEDQQDCCFVALTIKAIWNDTRFGANAVGSVCVVTDVYVCAAQ